MTSSNKSKPAAGHRSQKIRLIGDQQILFDSEGFLWNPADWSEQVAEILAAESGLAELNEFQWRILHFLRDFYFQNGRAPMNRDIKAEIGLSFMEMEALFPDGIRRGARRVAGLPNPKTCSG